MTALLSRIRVKHGRAVNNIKTKHPLCQSQPLGMAERAEFLHTCCNIIIPLVMIMACSTHIYTADADPSFRYISSFRYGKWRDDIGRKLTFPSSAFFSCDPSTPLNVFGPVVQCTTMFIPFLNVLINCIRIGRCGRYTVCPMPYLYH